MPREMSPYPPECARYYDYLAHGHRDTLEPERGDMELRFTATRPASLEVIRWRATWV